MDWEIAFRLLNAVVMPWWITWLVAPRSRWARGLASHGGVFVALAVVYGAFLIAALSAVGEGGGFDFDGLRSALSTPLGFLVGWTHFIAFDLFVGAWIVRDSARIDVEPRAYLFFTLMAGPLGLGSFLARRWLRLRQLGQLGDTNLV